MVPAFIEGAKQPSLRDGRDQNGDSFQPKTKKDGSAAHLSPEVGELTTAQKLAI